MWKIVIISVVAIALGAIAFDVAYESEAERDAKREAKKFSQYNENLT